MRLRSASSWPSLPTRGHWTLRHLGGRPRARQHGSGYAKWVVQTGGRRRWQTAHTTTRYSQSRLALRLLQTPMSTGLTRCCTPVRRDSAMACLYRCRRRGSMRQRCSAAARYSPARSRPRLPTPCASPVRCSSTMLRPAGRFRRRLAALEVLPPRRVSLMGPAMYGLGAGTPSIRLAEAFAFWWGAVTAIRPISAPLASASTFRPPTKASTSVSGWLAW